MDIQLIQLFTAISWAGAGAMFVYFVLSPLVNFYINKRNGTGKDLEKRVNEFETNHLGEINRRLDILEANNLRMWQSLDNIKDEMSGIKERLSSLEAKIK